MNGLRMFIIAGRAAMAGGYQVFYSRRATGPYYRWWYEFELQQWRSARVHPDELAAADLCVSSWKNVPPALQGSVTDHYLE